MWTDEDRRNGNVSMSQRRGQRSESGEASGPHSARAQQNRGSPPPPPHFQDSAPSPTWEMERQMETLQELDSELSSLRSQLARTGLQDTAKPKENEPACSDGGGSSERLSTSGTLLAMSREPGSGAVMRESGCVGHLLGLLHPPEVPLEATPTQEDVEVAMRAAEALLNVVQQEPDERKRRREVKVVRLLGQVRAWTLQTRLVRCGLLGDDDVGGRGDVAPVLALLMQLSFTPEHRGAITTLGGLEAFAELLISDEMLTSVKQDQSGAGGSLEIRRYVGMSLTNLTFGDESSKALLTAFPRFLHCVIAQIKSPSEELRSVYGSVVRNLSWKADEASKQRLEESGAVAALTAAALETRKEASLKALLSALWNLSAHSTRNKRDICDTPHAVAFLVHTLSLLPNTAVVENGGGILRNISSQIAVSEPLRQVLREKRAFKVLMGHLESPSLTIVSNACGTLWNLSARCPEDQRALWKLGVVPKLQVLMHSKHRNIAQGATAALRNLLSNPPVAAAADPLLLSSAVHQPLRSMEASTESERSFSSSRTAGSHHAQGRHLLQMMERLVSPSARLSPAAATRATVSCSPEPRASAAAAAATRRCSKEEVMSADRAAVQRYHSSLRKRYTHHAAHQGGEPQLLTGSQRRIDEEDHPQTYAVEATPQLSSNGREDLESPLMGSRHSSCDSLVIGEEQNSSDFLSTVPSVYSTRNPTGVVTPSDLPDSPSRSMPVSPPPPMQQPRMTSPPARTEPNGVKKDSPISVFSQASSFSAIVIDDIQIKPMCPAKTTPPEDDPEYALFAGKDEAGGLLAKSLISAYPSPVKPQKGCRSRQRESPKAEDLDVPHTFQVEGHSAEVRRLEPAEDSQPGSGTTSRGEPASSLSIMAAIDSVLPKPRTPQVTPPRPVAVTKPMLRSKVPPLPPALRPDSECQAEEEEELTKVFADEGTPFAQSRAHSPPPIQEKRWAGHSLSSEGGILEASEISLMGHSESSVGGAFLLGASLGLSATSQLEDCQPPDELMQMSGCSLMRNSATSEKVKDASNLLLRDSLLRQARAAEPQPPPPPAAVRASSSETSGSLSEDNYSRLDDQEAFDISPEDIDLSLVEEDARDVVLQMEGDGHDELLIDCETLSLVSNDSFGLHGPSAHSSPAHRVPRIAKEAPQSPIPLKGQKKASLGMPISALSAPVVKTTKTAQLRAKNASGSGLRPPSASSSRTPSRSESNNSGRFGQSRRGSPSSSGTESERRQLSRQASSSSAQPRPPVPPKPTRLRQPVRSPNATASNNNQAGRGGLINVSPDTAAPKSSSRSKLKYTTSPSSKLTPKSTASSRGKATAKAAEAPPRNVKGNSKQMLVTTV